ncbi:YIP1 family protein [Salinibaculum salinum]|uniref:YIP1 family protein n=1 Tax=Salinibaculum salinum TaxID=3131996 RepID=UPI0030EC7FF1
MTQWVENPELGRERGPVALARAWIEILLRPNSFFREKIAPGDQAPGLTFAATVVFFAEAVRLATTADAYPVVAGQPAASAILWLLVVMVLVTPAGIHLTAALQTVILIGGADDRAGVSETVQVICYSLAPLAFLGIPSVWVKAVVVLWAAWLFVYGMATVHDIWLPKAVGLAAVPAVLILGYGFGGNAHVVAAGEQLLAAIESAVG